MTTASAAPCPVWGEDFWGLTAPSDAELAQWLAIHAARFARQLGPDGELPPAELAATLESMTR